MLLKQDVNGLWGVFKVVPTKSLADLIERHCLRHHPELNYVCRWRDVRGFGVLMATATWVPPGSVYHVPE